MIISCHDWRNRLFDYSRQWRVIHRTDCPRGLALNPWQAKIRKERPFKGPFAEVSQLAFDKAREELAEAIKQSIRGPRAAAEASHTHPVA